MTRSGRVARGVLFVMPEALQVGVGLFAGAVTALRGLVVAAALVPVLTVVTSTIEVGRIARTMREGGP